MTQETLTTNDYPNLLERFFLIALEEVIGKNGVNTVLNQADLRDLINYFPNNILEKALEFDDISHILLALEAGYGKRGGQGFALRAGRACFKHILREFGPNMGFTDLAFRLLRMDEKINTTAEIFADLFNKYSNQQVEVIDQANRYLWRMVQCPFCWQRQADSPVCFFAVGLIHEALYWVSGGKFYHVEETDCIAKGDLACVIMIDKLPVE
jgi:predicted hydrocarbon binding protein